jgi:ADP-ribose pyrophosphatase YjhB (NUDIX family)
LTGKDFLTTNRRFCRFNKGQSTTTGEKDPSVVTTKEIPDGGLCLSSFLVLAESLNPNAILMGHLNPKADWESIGALDPDRAQAHSKGWMLPSSHLMIHESPQAAAKRIALEQLELDDLKLSEPKIVSEVYSPRRFPNLTEHWDIEFIFLGTLEKTQLPKAEPWSDLRFIDPAKTSRLEYARSHEDILASAGFQIPKRSDQ